MKFIHGESKTVLFNRWKSMIGRVSKNNKQQRTHYFDRGIGVCEEWKDYLTFKKWALENGFEKDLELDRKDNDKGYSPDNCRFVEKIINTSNRSNTIMINYKGSSMPLTLFCMRNNIPKNKYKAIRYRINAGWPFPLKRGNFRRIKSGT